MTYYEELDVSPAASTDEIRHAYKTLARLLHPDQYSDQNLKRLAELQMRRLNQMLAELVDSEGRRQYDLRLKAPAWAARQKPEVVAHSIDRPWRRRLLVGLCAWLPPAAVLAILLAALMYYGSDNHQAPAPSIPAADTVKSDAAPSLSTSTELPNTPPAVPEIGHFGSDKRLARVRSSETEFDQSGPKRQWPSEQPVLTPPPVLRQDVVPEPSPVAWRVAPESRTPFPLAHAEPLPADHAVLSASKLSGHWFYVAAERQSPASGMYLPEYIELHLIDSGGVLRGRYLARYRVTDRAIEPNVAFEFKGAASTPAAQFAWSGPGQAAGNVTLRLLSADRLEVTWVATHLSTELNLASGNAQLVRQKER